MSTIPNPGTEEAIKAGCICPVLDNAHGKGYMGSSDRFVYTVGCPIHTPEDKDDIDWDLARDCFLV